MKLFSYCLFVLSIATHVCYASQAPHKSVEQKKNSEFCSKLEKEPTGEKVRLFQCMHGEAWTNFVDCLKKRNNKDFDLFVAGLQQKGNYQLKDLLNLVKPNYYTQSGRDYVVYSKEAETLVSLLINWSEKKKAAKVAQLIDKLIDNGLSATKSMCPQGSLLDVAVKQKNLKLLNALICCHKIDLNENTSSGEYGLLDSAFNLDSCAAAILLIKAGANPNQRSDYTEPVLSIKTNRWDYERGSMEKMIDLGANVEDAFTWRLKRGRLYTNGHGQGRLMSLFNYVRPKAMQQFIALEAHLAFDLANTVIEYVHGPSFKIKLVDQEK